MTTDSTTSTGLSGETYGLGIRLGLYLLWASLFLLRTTGYGSWASLCRICTSCLLVCCVISTKFLIDLVKSRCSPPDFLIVFYLTVVLFLQDSYNLYERRNEPETGFRYELQPDFILLSQNVFCLAANSVAAWYWIDGINHVPRSEEHNQAGLLVTFSLYGTLWRRFAATFAIIMAVFFCILCFIHGWGLYRAEGPGKRQQQYFLSKKIACPNLFPWENKVDFFGPILRPRFPNAVKLSRAYSSEPKKFPKVLLVFTLRLIYWSAMHLGGSTVAIVSVERMIRANGLQTDPISSSTGQILVLAIGIANLVVLLWEMGSNYWGEVRKSPSCLQDTLSIYAYHSSRPLDEEQLESVLQELLYSSRNWRFIPGLFITDKWNESLGSLLQTALLRELVKRLDATVEKDNAPAPIEQYLKIRAVDKTCSRHNGKGDLEDVALSQAVAHGHLGILQTLLDEYGGCGTWKKFHLEDDNKEDLEIILPIPQTVGDIRKLCEALRFAEYAAEFRFQWGAVRLLGRCHEYLGELAAEIDEKSDTCSTATLSESLNKGLG